MRLTKNSLQRNKECLPTYDVRNLHVTYDDHITEGTSYYNRLTMASAKNEL